MGRERRTSFSGGSQDRREVEQFSKCGMGSDGLTELDRVEIAHELRETYLVVYDEDGGVVFVEADEFESCGSGLLVLWYGSWRSRYLRCLLLLRGG